MFIIDLGAQSHYSVLSVSPDASASDIRNARDEMARKLQEDILRTKDSNLKKELEEKLKTINAAGEVLARPDERSKYDRTNAHLRFFLIQNPSAIAFDDTSFRFEWLHRVIRKFLAAKGTRLLPLSDLERTDFSEDQTPCELLDELLKET